MSFKAKTIPGLCLLAGCSLAQAGLFDALTKGIGSITGQPAASAPAAPDADASAAAPDPATFKPVTPTVSAEHLEALPPTKKVILSNFVVEFQQQYEKRKTGFSIMGLGGAGSSTAIMDVTLPSQETLQAITNFAYLDTLKKAQGQGLRGHRGLPTFRLGKTKL
jgi:hypothetical protein